MKFKAWFDSMQGRPYDSMYMFALDAWNAAIKSSTANDELLNIHTILMAPGDCPESTGDDTLTVRLLKDVIHDWHTATRERDHYKEMDALHIQSLGMKSAQLAEAKTPNLADRVTPTYGAENPPRLRKQGESIEEYRAAMGWSNKTPNG